MSFSDRVLGFGAFPNRDTTYEIEQSLCFSPNGHLSKDVGTASNRKTWTWSAWIKRETLGTSNDQMLFNAYANTGGSDSTYFAIRLARTAFGAQTDSLVVNGWNTNWRITSRLLRDPSAWYHIVVAVDTTQSTANDRIKVYINGSQVTSFQTTNNPSEDDDLGVNLDNYHMIGAENVSGSDRYYSGYMAEVHFIDGTALAASAFGETHEDTGQWIPKEYDTASGAYGTNGFYFKFVSGAVGTDSSGEGNDYGTANIDSYDVTVDTPTNNFCTGNPLLYRAGVTKPTFTQGNTKWAFASAGGSATKIGGTIPVTSGKWYFEVYVTDLVTYLIIGIADLSWFEGTPNSLIGYTYDGSLVRYGTTTSSENSYTDGDIIGIAYDLDGSTMKCYKNGTLEGTISGTWSNTSIPVPAVQGNTSDVVFLNFGTRPTFNNSTTAGGNSDENGIGNFKYAVPSGYLALCAANLPVPTITKPTDYFNTVLWEGTGSTDQDISGVGFAPDFVWIKNRAATNGWHAFHDAVRTAGKTLFSNDQGAENDYEDYFGPFQSDGYRLADVSTGHSWNTSSTNYVGWNWLAGTAFSNDASATSIGTNDSSGEVNSTAGFSIVKYTGTGSDMTFKHGLSTTPNMVIFKDRDASTDWFVYHSGVHANANNYYLRLNSNAEMVNSGWIGVTSTTTRVYSFPNTNTNEYIAYHFHDVEGYSKFGSFKGNGSADGPFINTGFRPAYLVTMKAEIGGGTANWSVNDNKRGYNGAIGHLAPNDSLVESSGDFVDFLSNGFKIRHSGYSNTNTYNYIYMAFAESPFKYSNAR